MDEERLSAAQGIQLCRLRDETARPWSYAAVAIASFVLIAAATIPTPLYQLYQARFHFSEFTLTLIFGIYAFGVIPALLIFGPLGDAICRRRVLMAAICIASLGILLLALAQGVFWLLAGRLLVGVAVGATQGNASAALVEMQPHGDRRQAGIMTAVCTAGGAATGTLFSGILTQYLPDPFTLAYLVELAMLAVALALVAGIREAASPVLSFVSFHRPQVPRAIMAEVTAVSLAGGVVWSIAELFLALVPSYVSHLLHTRNLAAGGALVALMLGTSVTVQIALIHLSNIRLLMFGLGWAVMGLAALVASWHLQSLVLMIAGAIASGCAIGMAYLGSISEINRLASPEERGQVNSLYFVIVYLFFSIPTMALGFVATHLGLYTAMLTFACVIATLTLTVMAWLAVRQRHGDIPDKA
jgi:predicted MFS family arabinose efflux permease